MPGNVKALMTFDSRTTAKVGSVEAALILHHLSFWINQNWLNERADAFEEGEWWTYQTAKEMHDRYLPLFSSDKIQKTLRKLDKAGIIETRQLGRRNAQGVLDRTKRVNWYRIIDEDVLDWEGTFESAKGVYAGSRSPSSKIAFSKKRPCSLFKDSKENIPDSTAKPSVQQSDLIGEGFTRPPKKPTDQRWIDDWISSGDWKDDADPDHGEEEERDHLEKVLPIYKEKATELAKVWADGKQLRPCPEFSRLWYDYMLDNHGELHMDDIVAWGVPVLKEFHRQATLPEDKRIWKTNYTRLAALIKNFPLLVDKLRAVLVGSLLREREECNAWFPGYRSTLDKARRTVSELGPSRYAWIFDDCVHGLTVGLGFHRALVCPLGALEHASIEQLTMPTDYPHLRLFITNSGLDDRMKLIEEVIERKETL